MATSLGEGCLVLSDVHLLKIRQNEGVSSLGENTIYQSDFRISCNDRILRKLHQLNLNDCAGAKATLLDEDGDMVLPRRRTSHAALDLKGGALVLRIYHSMETQLRDVGLQVWTGALVMVDYILDKPDSFADKHILELGGGAGIPSIVAGTVARSVTVTDLGSSVLRLCEMNYLNNASLVCCPKECFVVKELDWFHEEVDSSYPFDCVIACDVIYDNDITDAFFRTVHRILRLTKPMPQLYISLEKRLNFTTTELDVTCREYDHFQLCLSQLHTLIGSLQIRKIDTTSISQHCNYHRTPQSEIWMISEG